MQRWQGLDRFYQQVQAAVTDAPGSTDEAFAVAEDLRRIAQRLDEDVQVWRGIRSVEDSFDSGLDQLAARPAAILRRFLSTSVHQRVARSEFTRPGRDPALLKITARAGVRAVWIPPIGDPDMSYQGELLFQPGALVRIVSVEPQGDVPLVEMEVRRP